MPRGHKTEVIQPETETVEMKTEVIQPVILDSAVESTTGKTVHLNENGVEVHLSEMAAKTLQKLQPNAKFIR